MEPTEMQEFSNQMKEAGEKGESLTNISLAISILAVLVAMVTVMGHRTHTEAVLAQAKAGDTWNEYQAKKIRSDDTSIGLDLLTLQPNENAPAVEKKIEEYRAHLDKWKEDLAEAQKKAHEYEEDVERAELKATRYDLGRLCCRSRWCSAPLLCSRGSGCSSFRGSRLGWLDFWWLDRLCWFDRHATQ